MTILWILLGIVYIACWIYFGLAMFRKSHYWMFWIGLDPHPVDHRRPDRPTQRAAARATGGL